MEDKTYIEALIAAPSTGEDRTLEIAVIEAQPRFDETIRAFKTMWQSLVDWFQHTLQPAVKLVAEAIVRALTSVIVEAGRRRARRKRGYTTRQLRMAARRITITPGYRIQREPCL